VIAHPFRLSAGLFLAALLFVGVVPARARSLDDPKTPPTVDPSTPAPAAQAAADDDDDAVLRPLEPDFTLINLPTTLPLPLHKGNFRLTHRFNGNLRVGDFGDQASSLFGIDEGATIGFEYRFAVAKHVEAAAYRTNFNRTIQLYGKYDAFHESATMPVGVSAIVSIEGTNNFRDQYAPAIGASISRDVAKLVAVYAVPMWVHNTAAGTGVTRDTFMVGLGGSLRVRPTLYLLGEVTPRAAGFVEGDAEYGFGISMRVGGHVFDLTFTNTTQGTTFAQMARGGFPESLYFGFNLARKFY
jgi:uncharacterized beta barrel domain-containing protein DUF5777